MFLSLSSLLNTAFAEGTAEKRHFNVTADFTFNSSTITNEKSATAPGASTDSSFTAVEVGGEYFFNRRVSASAQMLFALTSSVNAEIKGYDAGLRYYPFQIGHQSETNVLGSQIESSPGLASFIYGGLVSRDFQMTTGNVAFQGIEAGGGADFHFQRHFFLRGSLSYQLLQSSSNRSLNGFTAALGLGYSF